MEDKQLESRIQQGMRSLLERSRKEAELDSLTFEGVRRLLEEDLALNLHELDEHKEYVKQLLHEYLRGPEDNVKKAIWKRATYFRSISEELTFAGACRQLEEDLGLKKFSLDSFKKFISKELDEVLNAQSDTGSKSDKVKKAKVKKAKVKKAIWKRAIWERATYFRSKSE